MTTTLDIAELAQAIVWPLIILIVVLAYRTHLLELIKGLATRVKSLSLAGFSVELSEATQLTMATGEVAVDLRHAGRPADVNDSTLRTFYEQVRETSRLDYVVVDLGAGHEWLTSRLHILSVILRRMRGLKTMVFVETLGDIRRRFLGTCDCEHIRWKLSANYAWFEAALALAESRVWLPTLQMPVPMPAPGNVPLGTQVSQAIAPVRIANASDEGRIEGLHGDWPQPAADLLKYFLDGIQSSGALPGDGWEELPPSPHQPQPLPLFEHGQWLSGRLIEALLGDALQTSSVRLRDLQGKQEVEKARLVLDQSGRWIAVLRDDGIFDRLIDRLPVVEAVAHTALTG